MHCCRRSSTPTTYLSISLFAYPPTRTLLPHGVAGLLGKRIPLDILTLCWHPSPLAAALRRLWTLSQHRYSVLCFVCRVFEYSNPPIANRYTPPQDANTIARHLRRWTQTNTSDTWCVCARASSCLCCQFLMVRALKFLWSMHTQRPRRSNGW